MIKYTILTILILSNFILIAQTQKMDSLGLNNAPVLNKFESEYFNKVFKDKRGTFNFNDKKAIFLTGTSGSEIVEKVEYFERLVKPWLIKNSSPQIFFKILNEEEKATSGGYEVIILSWVKVFSAKKQRQIIKKIGKGKL